MEAQTVSLVDEPKYINRIPVKKNLFATRILVTGANSSYLGPINHMGNSSAHSNCMLRNFR